MTSSGDYSRWLQVRGSRQYEKLQNRRNSEAWNQIQSQSSTAQHPHCSTLGSRSQQRVISSSCSSWLGSSSVIPSSFRGFNSTRTHLWKRPIFVSFFCRFQTGEHYHWKYIGSLPKFSNAFRELHPFLPHHR